jgi:hypothetical protein
MTMSPVDRGQGRLTESRQELLAAALQDDVRGRYGSGLENARLCLETVLKARTQDSGRCVPPRSPSLLENALSEPYPCIASGRLAVRWQPVIGRDWRTTAWGWHS